jgi:uracil-DNA glycosylase
VDCCRPRLYRELRKVHPNAGILAMGKWALYALTGKQKGGGGLAGFHIDIDLKRIKELCHVHSPAIQPGSDDIAF